MHALTPSLFHSLNIQDKNYMLICYSNSLTKIPVIGQKKKKQTNIFGYRNATCVM